MQTTRRKKSIACELRRALGKCSVVGDRSSVLNPPLLLPVYNTRISVFLV